MPLRSILCCLLLIITASVQAAGPRRGTPDIKSAGPIAFGPGGILFVGDPVGAAVFAIETGDLTREPIAAGFWVEDIEEKVNALCAEDLGFSNFNGLAISPASGKAYLSLDRGKVGSSIPVIVRFDRSGQVNRVSLQDVAFTRVALPDPGRLDPPRPKPTFQGYAVCDLVFTDGRLLVASLAPGPLSSRIMSIAYPFPDQVKPGTKIEIFHGASGEWTTELPIWTFVPCQLKGEPCLLAAYGQTSLVKIPLSALQPDALFKATTVAELGNRNNPLDSVVYSKDGQESLLVSNTRQGVMKLSLDYLAGAPPIEKRYIGPGNLLHESIRLLGGLGFMTLIDDNHALVIGHKSTGDMNLFTIPLP